MKALLLAAAAMSALSTRFEQGIEAIQDFGRGIRDLGPDPTEHIRFLGRHRKGNTQGARYNRRLKFRAAAMAGRRANVARIQRGH